MMPVQSDASGDQSPGSSRRALAAFAFRAYKNVLSPALHSFGLTQCKYLPTCSEYAYVSVVRYGWIRGGWLAMRRVARCHPFAKGGADPVP